MVSGKAPPQPKDIVPDAIFIPKPYKLADIVRTVRYDTEGRVIQIRDPRSNGSDAGTTGGQSA